MDNMASLYLATHITPVIWDHVKRHITDEVAQGVSQHPVADKTNNKDVYESIKKFQADDRGQETCFVNCNMGVSGLLFQALILGIDYQTECLTMDTPSVVLVVHSKQCKLAQLLLSILSSHPSTFMMDVMGFLLLLMRQGTVQVMET